MIIGDTADNVNYFYGKGKAFAKKYLKDCKTKYQYTKKYIRAFFKRTQRQRKTTLYRMLQFT